MTDEQIEKARWSLLTKIKFLDDSIVTLNINFHVNSEDIKMDNLILLTDQIPENKSFGRNFAHYVVLLCN